MKRKRKLLGVLMIIAALLVMQLPSSEATAATSASEFLVDKDGVLTKYAGTDKNVVIPSGVVAIGTDAFKNNHKVTSVVIPDSVTTICEYAFWDCSNLASVSLGLGISSIGDYAFANCKGLQDMVLPPTVHSIGIYSFQDCVNMTDITIPYQVHSIHESAFNGCYRLVIHADEGTYAYEYAKDFYNRIQKERQEYEDVIGTFHPDESTENPQDDSVTETEPQKEKSEIEKFFDNFHNSNGTYSGVPQGVDISESEGNTLSTTHVVANQAVMFMDNSIGTVYSADHPLVSEIDMDDTDSLPDSSDISSKFDNASSIPKYTVVDDRIIADYAFYENASLESVDPNAGIIEIGQFSFARSNVKRVHLPDTVERISYGAFYHCDNLSEVLLPESLMLVEPNAFDYTSWVTSFLSQGPASLDVSFAGSGVFSQQGYLTVSNGDFLVSGGTLIAYRGGTSEVRIPDGVRVIAAGAFENHSEITSISIPDSLLSVGEAAFDGCTNLRKVSIGSGSKLLEIRDRAFADSPIVAVSLPGSLVSIGLQAFADMTELIFLGQEPVYTHEDTAERLSNQSFRDAVISNEDGFLAEDYLDNPESDLLTVQGVAGVYAALEGADRPYVLTVSEVPSNKYLDSAMERSSDALKDVVLTDHVIYDLELTDSSKIPITKLGRQALTVAIPIAGGWYGKPLRVYTIDRNGQLEEIENEIVRVDGVQYVRFATYHLSPFAVYVQGDRVQETIILEEQVALSAMMRPEEAVTVGPGTAFAKWLYVKRYRLPIAIAMICCGFILILWKKRL